MTKQDAWHALDAAKSGPVAEGNVGGGTGMMCHGWKGGTGTASRVLSAKQGGYAVGVLVQANHGDPQRLTIAGVPIGETLMPRLDWSKWMPAGSGSIIILVATDAPLLPTQLNRLAKRAALGVARVGGLGEDSSGDMFLAFSTANPHVSSAKPVADLEAEGVKWAGEIMEKSPLAIRLLKSGFNAELDGQAGIQELAGNATLPYYMTEEAKEFHSAQREKRKPDARKYPWLP